MCVLLAEYTCPVLASCVISSFGQLAWTGIAGSALRSLVHFPASFAKARRMKKVLLLTENSWEVGDSSEPLSGHVVNRLSLYPP